MDKIYKKHCEPCNKEFKSLNENQADYYYKQHILSKNHLNKIGGMRK